MDKIYQQIGNTPLSISIYSVEKTNTVMHDAGFLEIIFCLKGSVCFSYAYEEFTLHAGEFISVDRDAYYLYDGKDNLCVSFLIDLSRYEKVYPDIKKVFFVCEGCRESTMPYPIDEHNQIKGIMISLLKHMKERTGDENTFKKASDKLVNLFMNKFDICYFHAPETVLNKEILENVRKVTTYMASHIDEKITIGYIAELLNFSESYMSEYMRKYSVGFRGILNYIRANESERLLLKTDKNILQISEECGFSDVKYYKSAFKQWYRCTPKQFRQQYGKKSEEKIEYLDIFDVGNILDDMMTAHYMETFLD